MMKTLICIAHHYSKERYKYLIKVVHNLMDYGKDVFVIIDTNSYELNNWMIGTHLKIVVHESLEHPFHLTFCHRQHIKDNIDKYDAFMYVEDDILVPYENYMNYLENFKLLYPKYVPSFIRIEEKNNEQYVSDVLEKQKLSIIQIEAKEFAALPFPYNYQGFWIMPQKELKESMKEDFVKLSDGREFAASYVNWTLNKPALVELENGQVSRKCYSYHLPNNYALTDGLPNGKIKAKEIFI